MWRTGSERIEYVPFDEARMREPHLESSGYHTSLSCGYNLHMRGTYVVVSFTYGSAPSWTAVTTYYL